MLEEVSTHLGFTFNQLCYSIITISFLWNDFLLAYNEYRRGREKITNESFHMVSSLRIPYMPENSVIVFPLEALIPIFFKVSFYPKGFMNLIENFISPNLL